MGIISFEYTLLDNLKTYIYRQTTILPQVLSTEQKNRMKLSLANIFIKCHLSSKDNNRDDLFKIYIHNQTTLPLQILSIELKNKMKLRLVNVSIEHHLPSKNNNGDD